MLVFKTAQCEIVLCNLQTITSLESFISSWFISNNKNKSSDASDVREQGNSSNML